MNPSNRKPPSGQWANRWQVFCENVKRLYRKAYAVCYIVGVRSVRCMHALVRFTRMVWYPVAHAVRRLGAWLWQNSRRLSGEWRALQQDFSAAGTRVRNSQAGVLTRWLSLPVLAVRRHRAVFRTLLNVAAPLAAVAVLWHTVSYWQQANYALALEYQGEELGCIANESTYTDAVLLVENMVMDTEDSFQLTYTPKLTVTVAQSEQMLDEQAVRDSILESVGDSLTRTAGLYVDTVFRGALPHEDIEQLMNAVLEQHQDDTADHVDFFPNMKIVDGWYPVSSVVTAEHMRAYLETVPIKSVRYETHTESLAYTTETREMADQPLGYQLIITRGKTGKQRVTEEVVTVDGKERYRSVTSTLVLEAPTTQVIAVGAQTYTENATAGDGVATGTFIWPVPYTHVVSSPFASRWGSFHGAIDIANGSTYGKPIIASDGGTVIEAGSHSSYGNYVLIDHGNGFKTRYAHCSALKVTVGQKVAQGEYIANVGNTGYSFGAHLHFEVIKNGKLVDPLDYVKQ